MARGPAARSPEEKLARGNPGNKPLPEKVEDAAPAIGDHPPSWLKNETALKIWNDLAPELRSLRFLRATDQTAFARYCDNLARWIKLRDKVDGEGGRGESYTTTSNHGTMERLNPDFIAMQKIEDRLVTLEDRFGMSPVARQSILQRMAAMGSSAPAGGLFGAAQPEGHEGEPIGALSH